MTVREFKERLENLIMEGKGDYTLFIDYLNLEYVFYINDKDKEVYL